MSEPQRIYHNSDEHHPYADPYARSLALKIIEDFKPTQMIVGSDGIDFYTISSYDKDPARAKSYNLQKEIDEWEKAQKEWRDAAPDAERHYILGNHEDRLRRYLWRHPELFGLNALKIENLLNLDKHNIKFAGKEVRIQNLIVKHGRFIRMHSGYTAKAELEKEFYSTNIMTGHTHRGGSHYVNTRNGVVQSHEGFCLCDLNPDYVESPNWQQGVLLATVHQGVMTPEPIPFFRRRNSSKKLCAIWRGKEYTS